MKKILKENYGYIVAIMLIIILRSFVITPVVVDGPSMEDTLFDNELLLLDKISYNFQEIKRYDIVVIEESNEKIIKRVYGLPNEKIEYKNNKLYINNKEVNDEYATNATDDFTLRDVCLSSLKRDGITDEEVLSEKCDYDVIPDNYYLVLGDNRKISADSRYYGLISKDSIIGKTEFRFWPLSKFGTIK